MANSLARFRKTADGNFVKYISPRNPEENDSIAQYLFNGMEEIFKFKFSLEQFKRAIRRDGRFGELKMIWIEDYYDCRKDQWMQEMAESRTRRGQSRQEEWALGPPFDNSMMNLSIRRLETEDQRELNQSFEDAPDFDPIPYERPETPRTPPRGDDQPSTSGFVYPNQLLGTSDDGFRVPHLPPRRGPRRAARTAIGLGPKRHARYEDCLDDESDSNSSTNPSREPTPFGMDASSLYQKTMRYSQREERRKGSGPRANSVLADVPISSSPDLKNLKLRSLDSDGSQIPHSLASYRVANFEKYYEKLMKNFLAANPMSGIYKTGLVHGESDSLKVWLKKMKVAEKDIKKFLEARSQGDRESREDWEKSERRKTAPSSSTSPAITPTSRAGSADEPIMIEEDDPDIMEFSPPSPEMTPYVRRSHGPGSRRSSPETPRSRSSSQPRHQNGLGNGIENGQSRGESRAGSTVSDRHRPGSRRPSPEDARSRSSSREPTPLFGIHTQNGRTPSISRATSVQSYMDRTAPTPSPFPAMAPVSRAMMEDDDQEIMMVSPTPSERLQNQPGNGSEAPSENRASRRASRAGSTVQNRPVTRRSNREEPDSRRSSRQSSPIVGGASRRSSRAGSTVGALSPGSRTPSPDAPSHRSSSRHASPHRQNGLSNGIENGASRRASRAGSTVSHRHRRGSRRPSPEAARSRSSSREPTPLLTQRGRSPSTSRASSVQSSIFLSSLVQLREEFNALERACPEFRRPTPVFRRPTPSLRATEEAVFWDEDDEDEEDGRESRASDTSMLLIGTEGTDSDDSGDDELDAEFDAPTDYENTSSRRSSRAPSIQRNSAMHGPMEEGRSAEQRRKKTGRTPRESRASSIMSCVNGNQQTARPSTRRSMRAPSRRVSPVAQNGANGNRANGNRAIDENGEISSTTPRRSPRVRDSPSESPAPQALSNGNTSSLKRARAESPIASTSGTNGHAEPAPKRTTALDAASTSRTPGPSSAPRRSRLHSSYGPFAGEALESRREKRRLRDKEFEEKFQRFKWQKEEEYKGLAKELGEGFDFWDDFCLDTSGIQAAIEGSNERLSDALHLKFPNDQNLRSRVEEILRARERLTERLKSNFAAKNYPTQDIQGHLDEALSKHLDNWELFEKETLFFEVPTYVIKEHFLDNENRNRVRGIKKKRIVY